MAKVKGGHAIMLRVAPTERLIDTANVWASQREGRWTLLHKSHITVAFIGRDQDEVVGNIMRNVAYLVKGFVPSHVDTTGPLSMFGWQRDHLAANIDPTPLLDLHIHTLKHLQIQSVKPKSNYSWRPHLSLAKGEARAAPPQVEPFTDRMVVLGLQVKIGSEIYDVPG